VPVSDHAGFATLKPRAGFDLTIPFFFFKKNKNKGFLSIEFAIASGKVHLCKDLFKKKS
jgi:hypothetical protein